MDTGRFQGLSTDHSSSFGSSQELLRLDSVYNLNSNSDNSQVVSDSSQVALDSSQVALDNSLVDLDNSQGLELLLLIQVKGSANREASDSQGSANNQDLEANQAISEECLLTQDSKAGSEIQDSAVQASEDKQILCVN